MNVAAVVLPFAAFLISIPLLWNKLVGWTDLAILLALYLLSGFGITVGFHRLLTHRAFETYRPVKYLFAVLGTFAVQGPVIGWVADHRRHHAFTDAEGDPHSPHVGHGGGWRGKLRGLWHAHVGWLFDHPTGQEAERYAPDLIEDRGMVWISRNFPWIVLASLGLAFGLGFALTGTLGGALTALLWGGFVRLFFLHHVTFSINSICHFFGRRRFSTEDRLHQRLLALADLLRRVLAPQPSRLPALRVARPALVGARHRRLADRWHEARPPGLERRADHARAPGAEAGRGRRAREARARRASGLAARPPRAGPGCWPAPDGC